MLKKEVSYVDYDGNKVTETLYFNMTKTEIAAMQVRMDGKFIDYLQDLVKGNKIERLFHIFKDIVLDSYGKKSDDGRRFVKSKELRDDFEASIPFDNMMMEMLQDPDKQSQFVRAILPPDMTAGGDISASTIPQIS